MEILLLIQEKLGWYFGLMLLLVALWHPLLPNWIWQLITICPKVLGYITSLCVCSFSPKARNHHLFKNDKPSRPFENWHLYHLFVHRKRAEWRQKYAFDSFADIVPSQWLWWCTKTLCNLFSDDNRAAEGHTKARFLFERAGKQDGLTWSTLFSRSLELSTVVMLFVSWVKMGHTLSFNHKGKQTVPHFTLLFLSLPGLYQSLYQKHLHCEDSTESSPHLSERILERIKARFQEKRCITLMLLYCCIWSSFLSRDWSVLKKILSSYNPLRSYILQAVR